jgi:hypothetical protein
MVAPGYITKLENKQNTHLRFYPFLDLQRRIQAGSNVDLVRYIPGKVAAIGLPSILHVVEIRATILFASESRIRKRAVLGSIQRVRLIVNPFSSCARIAIRQL